MWITYGAPHFFSSKGAMSSDLDMSSSWNLQNFSMHSGTQFSAVRVTVFLLLKCL